jgi:hypothetical protein
MFFEDSNAIQGPNNESKLILIQPALNFLVPFIPTQLSFAVFIAISGLEVNKQNKFEVRVTDPVGELISSSPWLIEPNQIKDTGATDAAAMITFNVKNMVLRKSGRYFVRLFLGQDQLGDQFFDVINKEQGGITHAH